MTNLKRKGDRMFLIGMAWHWLMNMSLWIIMILLGCWIVESILKGSRGEGNASTTPISIGGIAGLLFGSVCGWVQGLMSMPEVLKDARDGALSYFQYLHRHTLNGAHIFALLGIAIGLIVVGRRQSA